MLPVLTNEKIERMRRFDGLRVIRHDGTKPDALITEQGPGQVWIQEFHRSFCINRNVSARRNKANRRAISSQLPPDCARRKRPCLKPGI